MSQAEKNLLIVIAIFVGAFIPFFVLMFGLAVGDDFRWKDALLFISATVVISSPIWIPACIPKKYKYLSLFFRWLGALILLVPGFLYFSGYFVTSKANFIISLPFIFIVSLCLLCIWILVKQDLVKLLK